jgi:hypothetical protein
MGAFRKFRFLSFVVAASCAGPKGDDIAEIRPRGWSVSDDGVSITLRLDAATVAPEGRLQPKLFFHAIESDRRHAKLLQGQFVFTFVPFGQPTSREAFSTRYHFSGAGDLDYSGKKPVEYEIPAPPKEGKYHLFATVLSSPEDVRAFLMTARMKAGEGPWWVGTMSTPSILVVVAADAEAAVRIRAQGLLRKLQQRKWTETVPYVIVATGKHGATTRRRMGIPDGATSEVIEKRVAEWFRQLYDVAQPGTDVSVRIDSRDKTWARVTYRAGDLDAFHMRLVDGQWYYALDRD